MNRSIRVTLLFCCAVAGMLTASGLARAQMPFEVLLQSNNPLGSPDASTVRLLQSQSELEALWRSLGRTIAPPQVDFRRHSVVVYFLGRRATGGYRLSVDRVSVRAGTMILDVVETAPGDCCVTPQVGTSPAIWTTTTPWKGPVEVDLRTEYRNCCP